MFKLENAITIFYSELGNQGVYWNAYAFVSLGLLTVLLSGDRSRQFKNMAMIGFFVFAMVNLFVIATMQSQLVTTVSAIHQYAGENNSDISSAFLPVLQKMSALPVWVICLCHSLADVVILLVMSRAKISSTPGG